MRLRGRGRLQQQNVQLHCALVWASVHGPETLIYTHRSRASRSARTQARSKKQKQFAIWKISIWMHPKKRLNGHICSSCRCCRCLNTKWHCCKRLLLLFVSEARHVNNHFVSKLFKVKSEMWREQSFSITIRCGFPVSSVLFFPLPEHPRLLCFYCLLSSPEMWKK